MSQVTIEKISVNLAKFKELRNGLTLAEYSEKTGVNPDMLSKIERGERWTLLNKFAEFCVTNNVEPNEFFVIIKRIS